MGDNKAVIEALKQVLADSYLLYLKTQNYHWNVEGPSFYGYHMLFEEEYKNLAEAVDSIAEHIRALGDKAPGSFKEFAKYAKVDDTPVNGNASNMVKDLVKNHDVIIKSFKHLQEIASQNKETVSESIAAERLTFHEKTAWMLRSTLTN